MCGRYVSATSPDQIADYFGAVTVAETLVEPNYNVAPTVSVPVVVARDDNRHLDLFRWGLVPSWAKSVKIGSKMINARVETVTTKNAFRSAIKKRRCIVPADAFYEWTAVENPSGSKPLKQPWCIQRTDGAPFAFAGLFEIWRDPEDDEADKVRSFTILTRAANEAMEPIHDRMPVMLAPNRWDDWIHADGSDATDLLASIPAAPSELLAIHAVSMDVNNSRSRGAQLMDPVEPLPAQDSLL